VIGRLVGTHVQRLATIAHGDGICTTHIPGAPAPGNRTTLAGPVQRERQTHARLATSPSTTPQTHRERTHA